MITLKNVEIIGPDDAVAAVKSKLVEKFPELDPDKRICKCDNCGEQKPMDQFSPLDGDWYARVEAGGEVPAAICDKCDCLAYLVKAEEEVDGEYDPAMNAKRADYANTAIRAFMRVCRTDREDALGDLLANLMHLADESGEDINAMARRAEMHYRAETDGKGRQSYQSHGQVVIEVTGGVADVTQCPSNVTATIIDHD